MFLILVNHVLYSLLTLNAVVPYLDGTLMLSIYFFFLLFSLHSAGGEFQHYEQETYIFIIRLIVSGRRNTWIKHTSTYVKAFFCLKNGKEKHTRVILSRHSSFRRKISELLESSLSSCLVRMKREDTSTRVSLWGFWGIP